MIAAPRKSADADNNELTGYSEITPRVYWQDAEFKAKKAWSDWLQGTRDQQTGVTASRASNVTTFTKAGHPMTLAMS